MSSYQSTEPAPPVVQRACECGGGGCAACAAEEQLGVQPKLKLGPVDDAYEREADRIADQVVSGGPVEAPVRTTPLVQRMPEAEAEEEELQTKLQRMPEAEAEEEELQTKLQRMPEAEEEEDLQMKAAPGKAGAGRAGVSKAGVSKAGSGGKITAAGAAVATGGQPLSRSERSYFEPRFGRDLSHVRLHSDAGAGAAAKGIGARAYTHRNHIAFAAGERNPGTTEGRRLMAHEIAHTLQQGGGAALQRVPQDFPGSDNPLEEDRGPAPEFGAPEGRPEGSTVPYAQMHQYMDCLRVMGDDTVTSAHCAHQYLGTPLPETRQVDGISTPVPFAARDLPTGGVQHRIGPVTLTILPDARSNDPAMANSAETEFTFPPLPQGQNFVDWQTDGRGNIASFTFNQDVHSMTIQTTYGPGASAAGTSGYGRGTTEADREAGNTSLGFHEGRHGRDFIEHLEANPYPEFTGHIGQRVAAFNAAVQQFSAALSAYHQAMSRASLLNTDCVGARTIDDSNRANGQITNLCPNTQPPAGGGTHGP